jgi:hypothetical protein
MEKMEQKSAGGRERPEAVSVLRPKKIIKLTPQE